MIIVPLTIMIWTPPQMPFYSVNLSTCYDRLPGVGERRLEASPASGPGMWTGKDRDLSLRNLEVISAGDAEETQGSLLSFAQ